VRHAHDRAPAGGTRTPEPLALAFLAHAHEVFAVPPDAVAQWARALRGLGQRATQAFGHAGAAVQSLSGGRTARAAYPPGYHPAYARTGGAPKQGPILRAGQAAARVARHGRTAPDGGRGRVEERRTRTQTNRSVTGTGAGRPRTRGARGGFPASRCSSPDTTKHSWGAAMIVNDL